ncbi:MAG: 5'-3' exonuclease H3TH domain-containing protein [Candidatus Paceibacterota bacterium]
MKTLFLIDANALVHRCFHALPPFSTKDGKPVGAIYGLASILIRIFREQKFDFIAAFFDRPEPTFRKEAFEEYKAHRPKAPDELVSQIVEAHKLFDSFQLKTFEVPGFEADDLIGTSVEKFKKISDLRIIILTGDLDTLQLVEDDNDKVLVETFKKGVSETVIYNEAAIKERYGVRPSQFPDYKGLVGDPSDNIPGVPGIGPKTAAPLIDEYGSLENLLEKGGQEKIYKKLFEFQDQALLSRNLSIIRRNVPLDLSLIDLKYSGLSKKEIISYFKELGFKSLVDRINGLA